MVGSWWVHGGFMTGSGRFLMGSCLVHARLWLVLVGSGWVPSSGFWLGSGTHPEPGFWILEPKVVTRRALFGAVRDHQSWTDRSKQVAFFGRRSGGMLAWTDVISEVPRVVFGSLLEPLGTFMPCKYEACPNS